MAAGKNRVFTPLTVIVIIVHLSGSIHFCGRLHKVKVTLRKNKQFTILIMKLYR